MNLFVYLQPFLIYQQKENWINFIFILIFSPFHYIFFRYLKFFIMSWLCVRSDFIKFKIYLLLTSKIHELINHHHQYYHPLFTIASQWPGSFSIPRMKKSNGLEVKNYPNQFWSTIFSLMKIPRRLFGKKWKSDGTRPGE